MFFIIKWIIIGMEMLSQTEWLLQTVLEFYREPTHLDIMMRISNMSYVVNEQPATTASTTSTTTSTTKPKRISIRIVNWFVSNYAKQHMTTYSITKPGTKTSSPEQFIVWNRFCAAKDGYASKDMFDPYCRKGRVAVQCEDGTSFQTTIGQLNFFKWAIQNKIIDYIAEYYDDIVRDMGARITAKIHHSASTEAVATCDEGKRTRKRREELSTPACRSLTRISLLGQETNSSLVGDDDIMDDIIATDEK